MAKRITLWQAAMGTAGWVALAVMVLACGARVQAGEAKAGEDRVQAELDRVKQMSGAEQQAWLARLEQRAARAARLTMSAEEAARQEAHTQAVLHQKVVSWQALRAVIDDTEAREKKVEKKEAAKEHAVEKKVVKGPAVEVAKPQAVKKKEAVKEHVATIAKPPAVKTEIAKPRAGTVEIAADVEGASGDKMPAGAVKVNVEELDARIGGCNLALRELEAELTEKDVVWNATKLEPMLDRLKELGVRHDDLDMFRNAVPKGQRAEVTRLESPRSAISQLSARVVEARNHAKDAKAGVDDVERQAELTRLDAISHRLAELGDK